MTQSSVPINMNLASVIDEVARSKGIDRKILIETLEAAILTAARRTYGPQREIESQFNEESGEVELFQIITVSEDVENPFREVSLEEVREAGFDAEPGDELLFQIFYREKDRDKARVQDQRYGKMLNLDSYNSTFGRIAAQTAKQVIIQRVREAERDIIFNEYKDTINDMVIGRVRRFEKGNIIVDLGRTDAILPRREQTPRESYRPGDRIQVMIKEVQRSSRDPQVVLTRADPQLLIKLFEQEVPEIYEGVVRIVAVAREPGVRSKVAVYSRDSDVDPVGACVGMRGSRVQAVVQELRGEKIDIVPYVEDTARFVCNAISPAEVSKVLIDESNMTMELIVPDDQLSLAIGRGGQNVRLAAQLTGWNLDIISETRLKNMMAESRVSLLQFEGITEDMVDTLFTLGYNKLEHMALATVRELAQIPGMNAAAAERIIGAAAEILARPAPGSPEAMTPEDRERKALERVRGVGPKMAEALHAAGYITIYHIAFEDDVAKLANGSGLGANVKKAKQMWYAAKEFLEREEGVTAEVFESRKKEFVEQQAALALEAARKQAEAEAAAAAAEAVEAEANEADGGESLQAEPVEAAPAQSASDDDDDASAEAK
ncbi:MAG: transcription termination factor NusA [Bradymonadaceae bacterium]|nr:transcription termination factor NusA [Lujinxingiaceae bacterium]